MTLAIARVLRRGWEGYLGKTTTLWAVLSLTLLTACPSPTTRSDGATTDGPIDVGVASDDASADGGPIDLGVGSDDARADGGPIDLGVGLDDARADGGPIDLGVTPDDARVRDASVLDAVIPTPDASVPDALPAADAAALCSYDDPNSRYDNNCFYQ